MACARFAFYVSEASNKALLLEGKVSLLRVHQEIPLNDDGLKAVSDGIAAHNELVAKLSNVPNPRWPGPSTSERSIIKPHRKSKMATKDQY